MRVRGGDDASRFDDCTHAELFQPVEVAVGPGLGGCEVTRRWLIHCHTVDGELAGVELVRGFGVGVEGDAAVDYDHGGAVGEEGQAAVEVVDELAVDARLTWLQHGKLPWRIRRLE